MISSLLGALAAPSRASLANLAPEQREKEDSTRVLKQRPILRVSAELALVGIIKDAPGRSGGEWIMKALKDLVRGSCAGVMQWSEIASVLVSSPETLLSRRCLSSRLF